MKKCTKCQQELSLDSFTKMKSQKDGLNYWCRLCVKKDREHKSWHINQYNERKKKWENKKYHQDINYKLSSNLRCRLNSALKVNQIQKNNTFTKYLGCNVDFFKKYIESKFKDYMSWDNHGEIWEIDHIIPLDKFDLTIENNIYKAFHYSNCQPLSKSQNRIKKNRVIL